MLRFNNYYQQPSPGHPTAPSLTLDPNSATAFSLVGGAHAPSRSIHKSHLHSSQQSSLVNIPALQIPTGTALTNMYRPGSSAGILNTIQVGGGQNNPACTSNILGSNIPTSKFVNMSRQYGVGGGVGTIGTTTIDYDDRGSSSALGFFPSGNGANAGIYIGAGAEDLESHILKNARIRSLNPRSQYSQRMHKTIDENMIFNKVVSGR